MICELMRRGNEWTEVMNFESKKETTANLSEFNNNSTMLSHRCALVVVENSSGLTKVGEDLCRAPCTYYEFARCCVLPPER